MLLLGKEGRVEVLEQAREVTRYLLRMVAHQSEFHTSQKLRRALQLYSTYSRLWGEEAARNMLASLRRTLASKGRHFLLSAVCFSNFNWDQEKISAERLRESAKDLESVGDLCRATIECHTCGKRQVIDQRMVDVDYCLCGGSLGYTDDTREFESWRPFIEREHHIVWRQRHHVHNHLFAYKVYGRYDDVSLSSFMETQLNSNYRTEWDDTALQLKVLDTHQESNSDLLYWLVKFPHFFANRDYVFKRRFTVNHEKREVVIMSEAVCPDIMQEEKGVHRVNEYWSTMVIRALGDVDQPGIEYTLTYFDNPGTSLPQSITNFIAVTGFPNFLKKLHKAALHLQSFHEKGEDVYVSLPTPLRYPQRWKKDLGELPEPSVPSGEELEAFSPGSEVVAVKGDIIEESSEKNLPGENQDEKSEVISLAITSAVVEGSDIGTESHDEVNTQEEHTTSVPHEYDEITSHIEDSSVSGEKTTSSSPDTSTGSTSDKSLHVTVGGKKLSVDLLEAMEVVAPDLEKKSLLLRKIEDLNEKLMKDDTKQSVILQKLRKLRHRMKAFQEEASKRRERSMRHMEQLSQRDHYRNMNMDDKTHTQLEMLFEAMRYVLQADKNMRTGKTLLEGDSATHPKAEVEGGSPGSSQSTDLPGLLIIPSHVRKDEDDQPPDGDELVNTANSKTSKKTKKPNRTHKGRQPPTDSPPPDSGGGEWSEEETRDDADTMSSEGGNYANELGNIANSVNNVNSEEGESSSWFAGMSVPYISAWWEAESRQGNGPSDVLKHEENTTSDPNAQTNTLLTQILYMITLRWMFSSEGDEATLYSEQKNVKSGHVSQEESEGSEQGDRSSETRWYWYPVSGAYRVYAWVFSASRENA